MGSRTDVRFHCSKRASRSAKKSRHGVDGECSTVKTVLAINTEYGVPIPGYGGLRKMRIGIPAARLGKSSGYRCIYRKARIDEIDYLVFLEVYFKGDKADLTAEEFATLEDEAEEILKDPLGVEWEDAAPIA